MKKQKIWLCQLLCPQRHTIIALAYRPEEYKRPAIEEEIRAAMDKGGINPWCGICAARELRFEHGRLPYSDWGQAETRLRQVEAANLITRALIGGRY